MKEPHRHVRHLRLSAAADDDARHAETLLRDALETMSLPGADADRHIVVRRLDLGRIPIGASAATLALHLERVAAAIWSEAVAYDLPGAVAANAVWFRDRETPLVALARRVARAESVDHWFWRAAVPGWAGAKSSGDRWRALLDAAHRLPAAPLVAAAVVDAALEVDAEDQIIDAIDGAAAAGWCRAYGWSLASVGARPFARLPLSDTIVDRLIRHRDIGDERTTWLIAMATVHRTPALAADPLCAARVKQTLHVRAGRLPSLPVADAKPAGRMDLDSSLPVSSIPHADPEPCDQEWIPATHDMTEQPLSLAREREGDVTTYAGLLFLIPVLERLGITAYLSVHHELLEGSFPARLLLAIGERVGLQRDDAVARALDHTIGEWVSKEPAPEEPRSEEAGLEPVDAWSPRDLPAVARQMLSSPRPRAVLSSPAVAWLTAVRRWCRRHARLGLATLVHRPGRLYATATHLDVELNLSQLDIRIRRAALDVDPGWVPWLGRVVQFHYVSTHGGSALHS